MEIVDMYKYPYLAKFEMGLCVAATQKKQDRELIEEFGRIEDQEEETIYELEKFNPPHKI